MDVRDAVKAYWLLVERCPAGEVYNIGGNVTMKIGAMLDTLLLLSSRKDIEIKADIFRYRPSDVTLQIPSTEKFAKETGWMVRIAFAKTLQDMLDYWRKIYDRNKI